MLNLPQTLAVTVLQLSGGGVKHAWCKVSSLVVFSLAVYKISSLAEFTCWLGKAEQLPLQWGGRSCVSIANNRFGEGVHPVRVNTPHCEACEARRGNPVGMTPSGFQPSSPSREGTKIRRCYAND